MQVCPFVELVSDACNAIRLRKIERGRLEKWTFSRSGAQMLESKFEITEFVDKNLQVDATVAQATNNLARIDELIEHAAATYTATQPELTVVIPVYNEPDTVLEIVQRVHRLPITKQIIVVNDGSTDGTSDSLDKLADIDCVEVIEHDINRGKGAALQTGFQHARGKYVIVQDADLEYDPIDILKVIEPLRNGMSDVVYGSRYLDAAEQDRSRLHRLGNWMLTEFSNKMTGLRLTDMETCYKAFRRELLQEIEIEQCRFGFEPEITAKIARQHVRIQEVGISYRSRGWEDGKKIGIKDLFNALYCIVRYSWF
jgi:glycosyltransferase involved in cell wall biosynthesis